MTLTDLDFSCLKDHYGGLLSPKDVSLFYYDIGFDAEMGFSHEYEWGDDIETFLLNNNLIIEVRDTINIPTQFENNKIYFSLCIHDEDNKAVAFIRHIRNAFSHYHIGTSGDFYCMKDFLGDGITVSMIGKIQKDLFRDLIDVFFKQKAQIENNYKQIN